MKHHSRWKFSILILSLSVLACAPCGLGDYLSRIQDEIPSEAIVAEAEAIKEAISEEVAETIDEAAENQDSEQGNETTSEQSAEAAIAADSAQSGGGSSEGDVIPLPVENVDIQGLLKNDYIDSYRLEYTMKAEGSEDTLVVKIMAEETRDPRNLHLVLEFEGGSSMQRGGIDRMELYVITENDAPRLITKDPTGLGGWISIPIDRADVFGTLPFSPDTQLPAESQLVGQEELLGYPTNHYVYDKENFKGMIPGATDARGEIWIIADKNIVVKYNQKFAGTGTDFLSNQLSGYGNYEMNFEITDLNNPNINITLPEEALKSSITDLLGGSGSDSSDVPMPEGAEVEVTAGNMVTFTVPENLEQVLAFYERVWGQENLSITAKTAATIVFTYTEGGITYQVIIANNNGTTTVVINKT